MELTGVDRDVLRIGVVAVGVEDKGYWLNMERVHHQTAQQVSRILDGWGISSLLFRLLVQLDVHKRLGMEVSELSVLDEDWGTMRAAGWN